MCFCQGARGQAEIVGYCRKEGSPDGASKVGAMTFSSDVVEGLGPVPQQMFNCLAAHLQASIAACEVNAEQRPSLPTFLDLTTE